MSFQYFPKVPIDHGKCPRYVLQFLWIMLQYSIQALHNIKGGALWQKIFNSWKLFLTVVT